MALTSALQLPPWIDLSSIKEIPVGLSSKQIFRAQTQTQESVLIAKYEAARRMYEKEKMCLVALAGKGAPRLFYHDDNNGLLIRAYIAGTPLADMGPEPDLIARCFDVYTSCANLEVDAENRRHMELLGRLHPAVISVLSSLERRNLPRLLKLLSSSPQIPCHRDFHPRNIIVSEEGKPFLIDFEYYGYDNPAIDAARMCFNSSLSLPFDTRLDLTNRFLKHLQETISFSFQDVELVAGAYFRALTDMTVVIARQEREIGVAAERRQEGELLADQLARQVDDIADSGGHFARPRAETGNTPGFSRASRGF